MPIGAHNKIPLTSAVLAAILAFNTANAQVVCGATDAEKLQRLQSATSPLDLSEELLSAAGQQQPRSVAWLLERGAPIDGHDTTGVTALMAFILGVQRPPDELEKKLSAAYKKLPPWPCERETRDAERAILRALLARSPDLEARDAAGSMALLMAARVRRFDLANALHDAGAKSTRRTRRVRPPCCRLQGRGASTWFSHSTRLALTSTHATPPALRRSSSRHMTGSSDWSALARTSMPPMPMGIRHCTSA